METDVVSSTLLWRAALVAALIDAPLLVLVAHRVPARLFARLQWYLFGAAFLVFALIWFIFGSLYFWDQVYRAIFPVWFRWLLPLFYGLLEGLLALLFWRVCRLAAGGQAVWFILLGGLSSLAGHGIGIGLGLLRVPLLAEASPASALVFGVFEFIFYWSVILGLGLLFRWLGLRIRRAGG
jgi:hypothetical protein